MMNYVNSNISWLGNIPEKWNIKKLKYLCYINTGSKDTQDKTDDGIYPFFVRSPIIERLNEYTHDEEAVMTAGDGVGVGKVFHHFNGKFAVHQRVYVFTNFKGVLGKYIYYYLKVNLGFEVLSGGAKSTVDSLRRPMLSEFAVIVPTIKEQKVIIDFLNQKTTKIEKLIDDKEQMIHLLEEKRQAIITEAVTKGLNPNVKMKDSGVEWISEIPEHWTIKKVGYLGRLQNGISKSAEEFGFGSPFISYSDVYKNMVLPIKASGLVNSTTGEQQLYSVEKGDVFFTRTSETIEEIGFAATCLETIPNATFAGFLIRFRPNSSQLSPIYEKYYFRSDLRKHYFVKEMNLVTRASLGQGLLRNFPVVLPNTNEQEEIAEFLDSQTQAINSSVTLIQDQIQKLKEYRQSLIYEAVTGKINVRDFEVDQ